MKIRIATRKSQLALWQANFVKQLLIKNHPDLGVELITMSTRGDKILDTPLAKIGGKGLFVKELEQALFDNTADIAVHSMKDVPVDLPDGLAVSTVLARENPHDAFVSNNYSGLADLPENACVGTSSLRRMCQLKALRPDLNIQSLRGNVNTRLQKLDDGEYDAIILACAGLIRLDMSARITSLIEADTCLPAIGQGIVGIEARLGDEKIQQLIQPLHHQASWLCLQAERALNRRLQGGCQVPIGGFAVIKDDKLFLRALVGQPDGTRIINASATDSLENAEKLGQSVADNLLEQGAAEILAQL